MNNKGWFGQKLSVSYVSDKSASKTTVPPKQNPNITSSNNNPSKVPKSKPNQKAFTEINNDNILNRIPKDPRIKSIKDTQQRPPNQTPANTNTPNVSIINPVRKSPILQAKPFNIKPTKVHNFSQRKTMEMVPKKSSSDISMVDTSPKPPPRTPIAPNTEQNHFRFNTKTAKPSKSPSLGASHSQNGSPNNNKRPHRAGFNNMNNMNNNQKFSKQFHQQQLALAAAQHQHRTQLALATNPLAALAPFAGFAPIVPRIVAGRNLPPVQHPPIISQTFAALSAGLLFSVLYFIVFF